VNGEPKRAARLVCSTSSDSGRNGKVFLAGAGCVKAGCIGLRIGSQGVALYGTVRNFMVLRGLARQAGCV